MEVKQLRASLICIVCVVLVILVLNGVSQARVVPGRDPRAGVLQSSLIVIVKQFQNDLFRVEDVFFEDASAGDTIYLPNFRLFTYQMYGPDRVEPITPDTRILLFLTHKDEMKTDWEVTCNGYCFFWTHDLSKVEELRKMGRDTVALRKSWEMARDIGDQKARIEALWPYLWNNDGCFRDVTTKELQKAGTNAGDYVAFRFNSMTREERLTILREAGRYGGEPLHDVVIDNLNSCRQFYDRFLAEHGRNASAIVEGWNKTPDEIKDTYVELVESLEGLSVYKDRNDLPLVRELALWGVKYRVKDLCSRALSVFREMPDWDNLTVIDSIWREFSARQWAGNRMSPHEVVEALRVHKYAETVPLLAGFLNDSFVKDTAQDVLTEIVGQDLGITPKPWLDWYKTQKARK